MDFTGEKYSSHSYAPLLTVKMHGRASSLISSDNCISLVVVVVSS